MRKTFAILAPLFLFATGLMAQREYTLDPRYPVHDLDPFLEVFPDPEGLYTPMAVLQKSTTPPQMGDQLPRYGQVGVLYWGRLRLKAVDSLRGWTLQMEDKWLGPPAWTKSNGEVDVYGYSGGVRIFHKKTGVEVPRQERDTDLHWTLNSISLEALPPGESVTLVFRVRGNSLGYPAYFNLSARAPEYTFYHEPYFFNRSFNIFMFGVTLIIFLYHLLQFLYLREKVIFWFTLWLLFCCITQAMTAGLVIGSFTRSRFPVQIFIANGIFYIFWFFGRAFTDSARKFPVLDRLVLVLTGLIFLEICGAIIALLFLDAQPWMTGVGNHYVFLCIYAVLSALLSIAFLIQKDRFARYFGVGSLIANLALIVGTLWSMGYIGMPLGFDPYASGILSQIIIYSFGIVYRRRKLARQAEAERIEVARSQAEVARIRDLDQLKSRFFTNISHELRTPLTLIQGPIRHALRKEDEADAVMLPRKAVNTVLRNTDRLQSLVDQLLELSRIESGKVSIGLRFGDLSGPVKSLAHSFESLAERENIRYTTDFSAGELEGWYDRDKLEKIIYNLLSNAFKYTPNGGEVRFGVSRDAGRLVLQVEDTGKGVAPEDLNHIFERFYRVEGNEEKGSGIGLALCKELVELQSGVIRVSSALGKGTTFRVDLPLQREDFPRNAVVLEKAGDAAGLAETAPAQEAVTHTTAQLQDMEKEKPVVLLAEDNPDLQEYISEILARDYCVLQASDGLQGERMAIEHIPDLVVSDVMMPQKDGFELCHAIKTNAKTSHIPVVLLTAKAGHENKMEGLYQGADAYLTKPFDPEELHLRLRNLLDSKMRLWETFKASGLVLVDDLGVGSLDDAFLRKIMNTVTGQLDSESLGVETLAREVGFSRAQLNRKLKALTGKSPNQLIMETRLKRAYQLLEEGAGSVSEVAYSVGYSNLSYFTKRFKAFYGCAPSQVIKS
ncbi:ATP-binding protein [Robiginitalea sediminis]|uniref:ATP-binding protein n=1 Tax=Robiginitalea sediminis TaxID=1982593 RepID=UPI000B4B5F73|nr:ATP-binding protein [Robiginitalea sediminis]